MADASHLERMGRELKCPICLSLLSSSVSLPCNHVFCSVCIDKSMKSTSDCPVCKVPFRRREIRPAPHMDNLVGVYKSMEVALGVDIFVTQPEPTKTSDNQAGVNISEIKDNGRPQAQTIPNAADQKQYKRKGSRSASVSTQRSSQSNIEKPSFPTKKRIQVSPNQTSGAQMEHGNLDGVTGETGRIEPGKCHALQTDTSFVCEKGEPIFSPFFWLRDEDDLENLSQQTDDDQFIYTPPDVPCFSDIKDSDDEAPCKMSPETEACTLPNKADFIDSEMFDWTQRPCSPELCSSPLALQVEDTAEHNEAQEKTEALMEKTAELKISPNKRKLLGKKKRMGKISDNKSEIRVSDEKVSNTIDFSKSKRARKTTCEVTAVHIESDKVTSQDINEGNKDSPLIFKRKQRTSIKVQEEKDVNLCDWIEPLPNNKKPASSHVSDSKHIETSSERSTKLKNKGKRSTTKTLTLPEKFTSQPKNGKSGANMIAEPRNDAFISQSHTNLLLTANDEEVLYRRVSPKTSKEESSKLPKSRKKVKFSVEGMSNDMGNNGLPCQMDQEIQYVTNKLGVKVPVKMDKAIPSLNGGVLHKCNTSPNTVLCTFCRSSEESEATGSMVHYLNGKLVTDNHYARTNTIHVHRYCTEWAPNVYFEEDDVINLETEISRSKRISCSCCGVKGAALGCYEKCCRKSFHVTCARLTPECRWDYENFVMLCPIHATCQLPNEMPQTQSGQKRKSTSERKSCHQQKKTTVECKRGLAMQWKTQKKLKSLVLCCSALTDTEKATVTEFENLSGVTILKNWDPTVTHVIASTAENSSCRRTLKYLMGVLEGKWILSVEWVKACIGAGELVDEQLYEISIDIHGIRDGPRIGRLRLLNKQPRLFEGYAFYFTGDFAPSYRGYLHDVVIAAGGKVLNRKPVASDHATSLLRSPSTTTFIIYSIELPHQSRPSNGSSVLNQRRVQAEALARSSGSMVASNSWILNSIAGYKLQEIAP